MSTVQNFMKKPVTIQAMEFEGGEKNALEIIEWVHENGGSASYQRRTHTQTLFSEDPSLPPLVIEGRPEAVIVSAPLFRPTDEASEWNGAVYVGDYAVLEKDGTFSSFNPQDLSDEYISLD